MRWSVFLAVTVLGCQPLSQADVPDTETDASASTSNSPGSAATEGADDGDPDGGQPAPTSSGEAASGTTGQAPDTDDGTTGLGIGEDSSDEDSSVGEETRGNEATGDGASTSTGGESSTGEPPPAQTFPELSCADESKLASPPGGAEVDVDFNNESGAVRRAYFLDGSGTRDLLFEIDGGESSNNWLTYVGHLFVITDDQDECVTIFEADEEVGGMDHQITFY